MPDPISVNPLSLNVRDAAQAIADKRLGVVDYVEAWLQVIEAREAVVGAWQHFDRDAVMTGR